MLRKIHLDTYIFVIKYIKIWREVNKICYVFQIHMSHTRYIYLYICSMISRYQIHRRVTSERDGRNKWDFVIYPLYIYPYLEVNKGRTNITSPNCTNDSRNCTINLIFFYRWINTSLTFASRALLFAPSTSSQFSVDFSVLLC